VIASAEFHMRYEEKTVKRKLNWGAAITAAIAAAMIAGAQANAVAPAQSAGPSVELTMQQVNQRVAQLPELANARDGDLITLRDDGSVTGSIWRGTYVYRPAGSKVARTGLYARWKDGVVTLTRTPNPRAGQPPLDTLTVTYVNNERNPKHVTLPLVRDMADRTVWRIPQNAWLIREQANGDYVALVDMFEFSAGDAPVLNQRRPNGTLPPAFGTQPVPVAVNAKR
jgi:hypothetical protein